MQWDMKLPVFLFPIFDIKDAVLYLSFEKPYQHKGSIYMYIKVSVLGCTYVLCTGEYKHKCV